MAKYNVTAIQAFAVLTGCSQRGNIKLRDVASHVVHQRDLPGMPGAAVPVTAG